MRKINSKKGNLLRINRTYEAEGLEVKIRRMLENGEPIEDTVPLIYTDKKDGVLPEYDIRTDRFDVAMEAMGKVRKAEMAKAAKSKEVAQAPEVEKGTKSVGQQPS